MSKNNQFTIDLGSVTLSDEQAKTINSAISSAVVKELAKITVPKNLVLVPVLEQAPPFRLINGIYIMPQHEYNTQVAEGKLPGKIAIEF